MEKYDIIIIGAGPAGLAAGIYAGRQGTSTLILDKGPTGGLGLEVPMMENYPGFEMISGMSLIEKTKKQVLRTTPINEMEEVKSIKSDNELFKIETNIKQYYARSIILCTGSKHRTLDVPGEVDLLGRGVCYCATCDGPLYVGKKIYMVGGGNTATQEAIFLKNIGCDVTIIHRRNELRAEKYLQDKLKDKGVDVIWNTVVEEIKGEKFVESLLIRNVKNSTLKEIPANGIFISIGEIPTNKLAQELGVELDKNGYIITDKFQRTNLPRVFAAGDITGGYKQWVVACGEGAVAAMAAYESLEK